MIGRNCLRALIVLFALARVSYGQILSHGPGPIGNLGIHLAFDPSPSLMSAAGAAQGAYIDRVVKGGPADQAGLVTGDVIVQFGQAKVENALQFTFSVFQPGKFSPGQTVEVTYVRQGRTHQTSLTVSEPTSLFPRMRVPFVARQIEERNWTENDIRRHQRTERRLYRDSSGRTAMEILATLPGGSPWRGRLIADPGKSTQVMVDEQAKSIVIPKASFKPSSDVVPRPDAKGPRYFQNEPSVYLGSKVIQGLNCEGYRTQRYLQNPEVYGVTSPGPLLDTREYWVSDLTVYPVLEILEGPGLGREESRLEDIQEGVEPDPGIFEIPQGYKVEER